MNAVRVIALVGALVSLPAVAHHKRVDPCGCHHQYGKRHCHPNLKSKRCEAPVKGTKKKAQAEAKVPAPRPKKEQL
jgi:hypothetical protein